MAPSPARGTGWDPWLLISQIVSLQSFHYLTLCMLIPPILIMFAEPQSLQYKGGALQVSMIMDWREMSSRPTGLHGQSDRGWSVFTGGGQNDSVTAPLGEEAEIISSADPMRGWCIAVSWLLASMADVYYLYTFVRRPRLILDFSLTLMLNHLILTTYYSAALPSSAFFWFVMISGTCLTIISAEQFCVRREMIEGLGVGPRNIDPVDGNARVEESEAMEMGQLRRD